MAPFLINTAEPMVKMRVVTVRDDSEQTLKTLQKIGVIDVEESRELEPADRTAIDQEQRQVNELLSYITRILGYLPQQNSVTLDEDVEVIYTRPFSEISGEVRRIYNKTSRLQEKIDDLAEESLQLSETLKLLEALSEQGSLSLKDLNYTGKYLVSRVIAIPGDSYEYLKNALKDYATENIVSAAENDTVVHLIADTRNLEKMESTVSGAGGRILRIPDDDTTLSEFLSGGAARLAELEQEKEKLSVELSGAIGEDLKKLVLLREALIAESDRLAVLVKASEAKYLTLIEGWVPRNTVESATADIKEAINYAFVDVREPEKGEEPPVKYRNPKGFKPFQIIVNMFATPKYREWDPTPVITYSFAFFFGLMVCDVLYALGLILLTKFVLKKFTDDPNSENFRQFQRLLYTCSGVALVGGLLTGQYFGNLHELFGIGNLALVKGVQEALQDPLTFIIIALIIGFIHINIGHILTFIKAIKEKDKGNIIGKLGLALLQLGIPGILHSILKVDIPGFTAATYSILSYFMLAGIVLIFVSSIMINKGLGAILWLFDITGLLGDVMSYARLAGVGLATYYLASTFNLMAGLFSNIMGGVIGTIIGIILAIFIIAFGHIINLVLTAITGFMHSLRLCFVEFLFKFYEGGGTEYSPFRLKKRTVIPVITKT